MKGSWLARLKTALLTAVMLSGGGGMPVLDLALYHGLAPDRSSGTHFESRTPHSHGDVCRLSSSLSHCPQPGSLDLDLPVGTISCRQPPVPLSAPPIVHAGLLPLPRAPPSLPILPLPQLT